MRKYVLAVAVAAAAALVTGGLVQASTTDAKNLQGLLTPAAQHPAGHLIDTQVSFAELAQDTKQVPWGMVWAPTACADHLEQGVPGLFKNDGWVRSTDRTSPSFSHDNFYLDMVADVTGGVNLDKIREAAALCSNGTLTLDGKVTGTVNYTEVASSVQGAEALTFKVTVSFPADADRGILAKYGYAQGTGTNDDIPIEIKYETVVISGNTLFSALSPSASVAEQAAAAFVAAAK